MNRRAFLRHMAGASVLALLILLGRVPTCPNCGRPVGSGAKNCPMCGWKLKIGISEDGPGRAPADGARKRS